MSEKLTIAHTPDFLSLCKDAEGSNRSVFTERVAKNICKEGIHVLISQTLHNDVEWRTDWFVSFKNNPLSPVELQLDVSFEALRKHTSQIDMPESLAKRDDNEKGTPCPVT